MHEFYNIGKDAYDVILPQGGNKQQKRNWNKKKK